jgi:hypothetical protein
LLFKSIDEAKGIRDKAVAMAAYARQAKNRDLEADAVEIRMRATRRLDQLRQAQKETVGLSAGTRGSPVKGARVDEKPTLGSQGIDKNLAHQARVLGSQTDGQFEQTIADARDAVVARAIIKTVVHGGRYHSENKKGGRSRPLSCFRCALSEQFRGRPSELRLAARAESELRAKVGDRREGLMAPPEKHYAWRLHRASR